MQRCDRMVDAGRRKFLSGAGLAAAGAAAAVVVPTKAKAAPPSARVDYPSNRLGNVHDLKVDEPLQVSYPDGDAPGVRSRILRSDAHHRLRAPGPGERSATACAIETETNHVQE